jgi:hypothetical protein
VLSFEVRLHPEARDVAVDEPAPEMDFYD